MEEATTATRAVETEESMSDPLQQNPNAEDEQPASAPLERRKFFPRVRALMTPEFEYFLQSLLEGLESTNCAAYPSASSSNPWAEAFEITYSGVASQCSEPTGKNRFHKFKDKVVEIWEAMEHEVQEKRQTIAHPIYARGLRQLLTYRSVTSGKTRSGPAKKPPPIPGSVAVVTDFAARRRLTEKNTAAVTSPSSGAILSGQPATEPVDPTGAVAPSAVGSSTSPEQPEPSFDDGEFHSLWNRSLSQLVAVFSASQPPKLPSPLQELHRIKIRADDSEELKLLEPHYRDALGKYLRQVSQQAANSSHPSMLPSILEGLDGLRSSCRVDDPADSALCSSIRYTYRKVLSKFLDLTNPSLASGQEDGAPPLSKRPRIGEEDQGKEHDTEGSSKEKPAESIPTHATDWKEFV